MTMGDRSDQQNLAAILDNAFALIEPFGPLYKQRVQAWEAFQKLKLPTKKEESFHYLRLSSFFSNNFSLSEREEEAPPKDFIAESILPECSGSYLVFVDGKFFPELSSMEGNSKKIIVSSLEEASRSFSTLIHNCWQQTIKGEKDPFYLINSALHQGGIFVYIPPKLALLKPIQIIDYTHSDVEGIASITLPRLQLFLGAHSEASLIHSHLSNGTEAAHCHSPAIELALEEGSRLNYFQCEQQEPGEKLWRFDSLRAVLKRNSRLVTAAVSTGSSAVRSDCRVQLAGEGADIQLNGICMLGGKKEFHSNILVEHQVPRCRSMQLFKSVLNGSSRTSFEGKILVDSLAEKTDAFQLNNNLLLSPHAQAYSKPNLEIFNADVKASHGATVGQVNKEQLFYLKTRGFSTVEAMQLLIFGFCDEVLKSINIPSLKILSEQKLKKVLEDL